MPIGEQVRASLDAKDKWSHVLSSSPHSSGRKIAVGIKLPTILAALFCTAVLGYLVGIRQVTPGIPVSVKTYTLILGPVHLVLTVGMMGILVILLLTILLAAALLFAAVASRRKM